MSIKPKFTYLLNEAQRMKEERRKNLERILTDFEGASGGHCAEFQLLKTLHNETVNRDQEIIGLLAVAEILAGYIDEVKIAVIDLQKSLQEVGILKSKLRSIARLAKKHDELYQTLDKIIERQAEQGQKVGKEIYV